MKASLFSINGFMRDDGDDKLSAATSNLGTIEQGIFDAIDGHDMNFACRSVFLRDMHRRQRLHDGAGG